MGIIGNKNRIKNSSIISGSIYQDCDSESIRKDANVIIADNGDGKIILNGEVIEYPNKEHHSVTIINNSVFVDGLEYKDGEWKRTLRALWHKWF